MIVTHSTKQCNSLFIMCYRKISCYVLEMCISQQPPILWYVFGIFESICYNIVYKDKGTARRVKTERTIFFNIQIEMVVNDFWEPKTPISLYTLLFLPQLW